MLDKNSYMFNETLRVRPESSCWIAKLSQHQAD